MKDGIPQKQIKYTKDANQNETHVNNLFRRFMLHCQQIWMEESEFFFLITEKIQLLENLDRPSRLRNPYPVSHFSSRLK